MDRQGIDMELIEKLNSLKEKIKELVLNSNQQDFLKITENFYESELHTELSLAFEEASTIIQKGHLLSNIDLYKAAAGVLSVKAYPGTIKEISFLHFVEHDEAIHFTSLFDTPTNLYELKPEVLNLDNSRDKDIHHAIVNYYYDYSGAITTGQDQSYFTKVSKRLAEKISDSVLAMETATTSKTEFNSNKLIDKAHELENICKQQIIDGDTSNSRLYVEFDKIAAKLVEQQYHRIDVEEDIEVMKVLARIPDPAAVCGEYENPVEFFKEYPEGDFYIHMNSEVFMTLMKTLAAPRNIVALAKTDENITIDFEPLKIQNPMLENDSDWYENYSYLEAVESANYDFSLKFLRSFITY